MSDPVLKLAEQQARTNALLEALTHEVRTGLNGIMTAQASHDTRIDALEHERTRARTLLRVVFAVAGMSGLITVWDRLAGLFSS